MEEVKEIKVRREGERRTREEEEKMGGVAGREEGGARCGGVGEIREGEDEERRRRGRLRIEG